MIEGEPYRENREVSSENLMHSNRFSCFCCEKSGIPMMILGNHFELVVDKIMGRGFTDKGFEKQVTAICLDCSEKINRSLLRVNLCDRVGSHRSIAQEKDYTRGTCQICRLSWDIESSELSGELQKEIDDLSDHLEGSSRKKTEREEFT